MKKILASAFFITLVAAAVWAVARQAAPRFEDYSVPVYKGRVAPLNLKSAKEANTFRTRLREGAKEGVNFAGHYTLVGWGCGTGCVQAGIIDAKTGTVYFPKELGGLGVWLWDNDDEPLRYKANSRLLVLSGFPASESNSDNPKTGLYYYEWAGTRLRLVKFVAKKRKRGARSFSLNYERLSSH